MGEMAEKYGGRLRYLALEVPFQEIDGKLALTAQQIFEDDNLEKFVNRFKESFRRDPCRDVYFFEGVKDLTDGTNAG